jgi:hypothetical protein
MPQLAVFATGCLLWVIAYAYVLLQARRNRVVEMAVLAAASNLAWEFCWGVPLHTDMGVFLVWTYRAWLIFDLFIFHQVLKLGREQFTTDFFKRHYNAIVCATVVFFIAVYWGMSLSGIDSPIGARSAYVCQFIISVLCLILLVQQPSTVGYAWTITWLRSLGTLLVSVFNALPQRCVFAGVVRRRDDSGCALLRVFSASARQQGGDGTGASGSLINA